MTNKILMVGVLDVPSSTNVFMKKGFEHLGYEVEAYNYRTMAHKLGLFNMWNHFETSLIGKKYDLIVFCKTNQMHPHLLEKAKMAGPTWYWFMDPLATAKATIAPEYAKYATYASATSSEVLALFKKVNPNSFQIIEGYDPDIYFYEDLKKIYDITFIGNATPQRVKDFQELKIIYNKIVIFGQGWPTDFKANPPVYNQAERRVINQSKIVLNLCQDKIMFSDRIVKSLACGALVLSQSCEDLLTEFYELQRGNDNCLLQYFDSIEQAHYLIKLYLSDPEMLWKKTRKALSDYMAEHYSWKAVCQKIMEKVNGN